MSQKGEIAIDNMGSTLGVLSLLVLYSLGLLFCAAWGLYILPGTCKSQSLRTNLRVMLVCSIIMVTSILGIMICAFSCREYTSDFTGIKSMDYHYPTWLFGGIFIFSSIYLGTLITVMSQFKDECKSTTFKNFEMLTQVLYGICSLAIIISVFIVFRRMSQKTTMARKQRDTQIAAVQQRVPEAPQPAARQLNNNPGPRNPIQNPNVAPGWFEHQGWN